ncbi:MAG TPA: phenylalanine--tRNA ligase subunit beta, partial [Thermoleophilia bacterium]|nr:phenylalanine--tRNA ligase subunit beta [Thermoleophilia bacterium]
MKAPLSWLREYVSIDMTVDELASRLALTGTEVERVSAVGVPGEPENLKFFVVGKVLECGRHPNADKLSVCRVDIGEAEPRTIVCGAPNVAAGQTVAVVLPGGTMPGGMQIREAKLRGVDSSGMILSEAELGLAAKSAGTMELPNSWEAGGLLSEHFLLADEVLEVEVTPNRPDCLSVRGLAREIAAISGASFDEDLSF